MRTYMMFIEYIPTFAFSNQTSWYLQEEHQLHCNAKVKMISWWIQINRDIFSGVTTWSLSISVSHLKTNKYQAQNSVKSFLLLLTSYRLDLKLKTEMNKDVFNEKFLDQIMFCKLLTHFFLLLFITHNFNKKIHQWIWIHKLYLAKD